MSSDESEDESDGSEGDEYYCDGCTAKPDADPDAPGIEGHRWHKTGEEYDLCRECFVELSAREQRKYEEFDENNMPVKLMRGRRSGVGAADQAAAAAAAAAAASATQAEAAMAAAAAAAAAASSSGSDDGGTSSDAEDDDDDSDEEDDEYYCDGDGCAVMYGAGADAPSISGHRWHKRGEEYDMCQTCFAALPQAERVKYQEFDEQQMPVGLNRGRRGVVGVGGDVQGNLALAARAASEAAAREAAALAELDDLDLDMDFGGGSGGEQQQDEEEEEEEEEESSSESEVSSSGEEEEEDGASDALAARLAEEAAARRSAEAAAARSAAELQRLKQQQQQQQQQQAALAREEAARRSAEAAAARSAAELQRLKQQQQQQQQAAEAEVEAAASEKDGSDSDPSSASEDEGGDTDDDGDEYFCDSCAEMDGVGGADSDPIRGHRFHKVGHEWDVCQSCFSRLAPSQRLLYEEFDADGIPVKAKRGRRGVVVQGDIAASAAAAQFEATQSHRSSEQPGVVVPESYSPLPGLIPQQAGGASDVTWQQQLAAAAAQHAAEVAELLSAHRAELSASQEACAEAVSRAFPSWNPSTLTEIYLCHACSDQKIEDGNGRAGEAARGADGGAGRAAAGGGAAAAAAAGRSDLEAVRGRVAGRGAAEAGGGGAPA
jgi:hypothetical protein